MLGSKLKNKERSLEIAVAFFSVELVAEHADIFLNELSRFIYGF